LTSESNYMRVIDILIARYAHMANYTVIMYEEECFVTSKEQNYPLRCRGKDT